MSERGFGEYLVTQGILHAEGLRQALDTQRSAEGHLDTVLLDLGLVAEPVLLEALGRFHSTRTVSRTELAKVSQEVARLISPRVATRLRVLPFRLEGKTIQVATLQPSDLLIEDEVGLLTNCKVSSYVALEVRLHEAMSRLYGVQPSIQIASVLKRLNNEKVEKADTAPVVDTGKPAEAARESETAPTAAPDSAEPIPATATPLARSDDTMELEISQEELDEFPSLRKGLEGEPPSGRDPALGLSAAQAARLGPDERLDEASVALQNAEMREDIGDALLEFCAPYLSRRLLLVVRQGKVVGWRGEGPGVAPAAVRSVSVPLDRPSIFVNLTKGSEFWLGALPAMPGNQELVRALGGVPPRDCVVLPMFVSGKPLGFLYGDNRDTGVTDIPISHLRRLVAKADLAFQVYLLKGKIRTL
jgi:hypothetical protein